MRHLWKSRWFRKIMGFVFFIFVTVALFIHSSTSPEELWNIVRGLSPLVATLIVITSFLLALLTAFKWRTIIQALAPNEKLSLSFYLHYTVMGIASALIASQAGIVAARGGALRVSAGMPLAKGMATVLLEQFYDYLILLFMLFPSLAAFSKVISVDQALLSIAILIPVLGIIFAMTQRSIFHKFCHTYNVLRTKLLALPLIGRLAARAASPGNDALGIPKATSFALMGYSLLRIGTLTLRMYLIALCFNLDIPFTTIFLALPIVMIATSAGMGFAEAGIYGVMLWAGIPPETAFSFATLCRFIVIMSIAVIYMGSSIYVSLLDRRAT